MGSTLEQLFLNLFRNIIYYIRKLDCIVLLIMSVGNFSDKQNKLNNLIVSQLQIV